MAIVRYTAEEAKKLKGDTDVERFRKLGDREVEDAAQSDPDSALPTPEQLKEFKRRKTNAPKDDHQRRGKKSRRGH